AGCYVRAIIAKLAASQSLEPAGEHFEPYQAPKALRFLVWLLAPRFEIMWRSACSSGVRADSRRFLCRAYRAASPRTRFFVLHVRAGASPRAFGPMASKK